MTETITKIEADFRGSNLDYDDDLELGPSDEDIQIDFDAIIALMLTKDDTK